MEKKYRGIVVPAITPYWLESTTSQLTWLVTGQAGTKPAKCRMVRYADTATPATPAAIASVRRVIIG